MIGLLSAFIVHEYAHAQAAYALGDPTSKYDGRLTLNPVVHLDPMGSLCMLISMVSTQGAMVLGWAKPVMFNRENFKNPFGDGALVALAGPMANFVLAILFALLHKLALPGTWLLAWIVKANLGFGLFNLFPLPPLDGWKIVQAFVSRSLARSMQNLEENMGRAAPAILLVASFLVIGPVLRNVYFYSVTFLLGGL
jgi:Zn-dependent protease